MTGFAFYKHRILINSILICVLTFLLFLSTQSGLSAIYVRITGISPTAITYDNSAYWSIFISSSALAYILSKIIAKFMRNFLSSSYEEMKIKNERRMLSIITAMSALLLVFIYTVSFVSTAATNMETLWVLNSMLVIVIFIFVAILCYAFFKHLIQAIEIKHNHELLNNFESYKNNIENLYTEIRSFRHSTINILSAAFGFIENDDFEGWKNYFKEEVHPIKNNISTQSDIFKQLENIASPAIKGLLTLKILTAIKSKCLVAVGIDEKIENVGVANIDLIRMLGILFDNAIEEGCKKAGTQIQFVMYKSNKHLIILVINEFYGEPPDIVAIFEKGYSTKGENRGVGLPDLQKIVDTYDFVSLHTYINENKFVQELTIIT